MDGVMSKLDVRPLPAPHDGLARHHRLARPVILAGTFMVVHWLVALALVLAALVWRLQRRD